ncbi:MAG: hypothetical protein NVS1B13_00220 [Flavisolibacter sp.]
MDYNRIVAITGLPGLFEVISSKSDGAIVRSLEDQTTKFVSSRVHNLSHLESIEVYTVKDNATLSDVFSAMKASSVKLPDIKDNKALKSYFEKAFPDLDFERVYASDMKKMIKWFEVLQFHHIDFTVKPAPAESQAPIVEKQEVSKKPKSLEEVKTLAPKQEKQKEAKQPKESTTKDVKPKESKPKETKLKEAKPKEVKAKAKKTETGKPKKAASKTAKKTTKK